SPAQIPVNPTRNVVNPLPCPVFAAINTSFLHPQERLQIYLDCFTSARTGHTRKIKNIIPTMISTAGGSWCCTRKTSMIATMENHCQRDRRNLSRRPENRKKLPKVAA